MEVCVKFRVSRSALKSKMTAHSQDLSLLSYPDLKLEILENSKD